MGAVRSAHQESWLFTVHGEDTPWRRTRTALQAEKNVLPKHLKKDRCILLYLFANLPYCFRRFREHFDVHKSLESNARAAIANHSVQKRQIVVNG